MEECSIHSPSYCGPKNVEFEKFGERGLVFKDIHILEEFFLADCLGKFTGTFGEEGGLS